MEAASSPAPGDRHPTAGQLELDNWSWTRGPPSEGAAPTSACVRLSPADAPAAQLQPPSALPLI